MQFNFYPLKSFHGCKLIFGQPGVKYFTSLGVRPPGPWGTVKPKAARLNGRLYMLLKLVLHQT